MTSRNSTAALYHKKDFDVMKSRANHPRKYESISSMSSYHGPQEATVAEFRRKVSSILRCGRNNGPPSLTEANHLVKGLFTKSNDK